MEIVKPLQLLIATGLYPPDIGGPATYSRMLEEKLEEHGVNLTILPFGTVRHLPKIVRHFVFAWTLFKSARGCDIIYALDSVSVGLPAYLVSIITRKPFFVRLGGDYAWEQGQQRFGLTQSLDEYTRNKKDIPFMVRLLASVQKFVVTHASYVIAPSEYLKSIIATWGVHTDKIKVIYSALFPLEVSQSKASLREQLAYNGPVVVTVGRMVPWKGFSELIDVIAELRTEIPDITLIIIGDGPLHASLQAKVISMGLEDHVRMPGKLGKEALGAALKGADVFVLNTSYEGLSHQLLEVMDLGIPIVTTSVGGNIELITHGVSGLLVPPRDNKALAQSIKQVLQSESLRTLLVQSARIRLSDFSQDTVVATLADFLQNQMRRL